MTRPTTSAPPLRAPTQARAGTPPPSRPSGYPGLDSWRYHGDSWIFPTEHDRPYETPVPPTDDPVRARIVEELARAVKARRLGGGRFCG